MPDTATQEQPREVKIEITLTSDGSVKVESPIMRDQILFFGLLKIAEMVCIQHNAMLNQRNQRIQTPRSGIIDFIRGKR